jgi:hypothetical protein
VTETCPRYRRPRVSLPCVRPGRKAIRS